MIPDVPGILAALARLPGTSPERAAALRVSRSAHVAARALRAGRTPSFPRRLDPRIVSDVRRRASADQPRDEGGRWAPRVAA